MKIQGIFFKGKDGTNLEKIEKIKKLGEDMQKKSFFFWEKSGIRS